jgi:hypothetical protein
MGDIFVREVGFTRRIGPLLAALATSTFCVLAHQGDGDPTVSVDSAAKLSDEALAQVHKGAFREARSLYKRAYAISPSPPILLNLALSELNYGWPLEALAHLRAYAKDPGADPTKVAVVTKDFSVQPGCGSDPEQRGGFSTLGPRTFRLSVSPRPPSVRQGAQWGSNPREIVALGKLRRATQDGRQTLQPTLDPESRAAGIVGRF